jgi:hypothetical protein
MFSLKPPRHISTLPRSAVAGRRMAQPVYPQLRKYPVRSGTHASCQIRTWSPFASEFFRVAA